MSEEAAGETEYITIKYPIYPNRTQERELRRQLDTVRILYNRFLAAAIADFMEGLPLKTPYEMNKEITVLRKDDADLRSVNVFTLRDAPVRVHASMSLFIGLSASTGEIHLPRFKGFWRFHSMPFDPRSLRFDGSHLVLSKKLRIKYGNDHRPKGGVPVTVRAVLEGDGRWYVHVTYEREAIHRGEEAPDVPSRAEGYDLGLVDIVTDTSGEKIQVPYVYATEEREIAKLQRRLEGLERGSPLWNKVHRRLARIHLRIKRRREGFLNSTADAMVEGHSVVAIEDLEVRKMIEKDDSTVVRRKRYTEASWGNLVKKVERKAERADVVLVKVNPAYTSRTCSRCGHVTGPLPLSERMFRCPECGLEMDRDRNAALNILGSGMGTLRGGAEPSGRRLTTWDRGQSTLNPEEP